MASRYVAGTVGQAQKWMQLANVNWGHPDNILNFRVTILWFH
jgi:hypothetical protein